MNQLTTLSQQKFKTGIKTKLFLFILVLIISGNSYAANRVWSGAANGDFNNLLNWTTFAVPGAGDTATIALTTTTTITLSADVTIQRLNFTMAGNTKTGILDVGTHTLTITGTTTLDATSGNSNTVVEVGVNGGTSAGIIDFGGTVTADVSAHGQIGFIGNANSKLIFRGDLTFGAKGAVDVTNVPGTAQFDATGTQTITFNNSSNNANFNNIVIGSTNNPTVTLTGTATAANRNIIGNLTINGSSTLDYGTTIWNRTAAGGTLALNTTSTLKLAASTGGQTGSNFPLNFSTMTLAAGSTVEYNSAGGVAQTIYAGATYGNLTLSQGSGSGGTTKSATAALTVAGNFLINANATFSASTFTHNIKGNWTNNGTFTLATSTINCNGTSNQNIGGSSTNTFNNLTINNSAGATLTANATVNATHTFTSGIVTTNSFKLIIATGGTVSRTSGHVNGFLQKNVATGATSRTFEVGGASVYAPIAVTFGSVTTAGNLTAKSTDGDHSDIANSGINASKSVNRNWTMTNSGIIFTNYSATFTFVAGDIDGGASTSNFNVRKLDGSTWSVTTTGTQGATSTQATGMTSFSDYQVGEIASLSITCPANFSVSNDVGVCQATVSYTGAHAATSTSTPAPVITYLPAGPFAVGSTTTVTATATNINGTVNCTFDVTVNDDEDPVISGCPSNIDVCGFVATWSAPTASDNCSVSSFTGDHNSGDTFPLGTTTVTYTATDVHSNTSTCQFTVTTHDPPTVGAGVDQTGCNNATFSLSGSIGGGASTSLWTTSGNGIFSDATLLNPTYTPGTADSIAGSVTLTLTTDNPAGACTAVNDQMTIIFDYAPPRPDAVTGPGPTTACNGNVFNYTTSAATATNYTWTSLYPASAFITNGQGTSTAEITFGTLPAGTSYYAFRVTASNVCGTSAFRSFSIQNVVGVPLYTTGLQTQVCPGTSGVVYSVSPGAGVTTYNWTVPTGASIVSGAGTTSITVDFSLSFVSGNITVSASNACMTTAIRSLFIDSKPSLPGTIAGATTICPGTSVFSITAVPSAVSYTWTVPSGVTIQSGQGTTSITALFANTWQSGNVTVTAVSGCSPVTTSTTRSKNITCPIPQIPSAISGSISNLCGQTATYTSASVTGATSYEWTVPAGCTLTGQGNQSVNVTFPSSGIGVADICVSAVTNLCTAPNNKRGSRCLQVKAIPGSPGTISGPSAVCPATTYSFSVPNVAGLTYGWTVPSGSSITSGAGTNAISVLWGPLVGYMNVTAYNSCGSSNTSIKLISLGICRIAGQAEETNSNDLDNLEAYPNPTNDRVTLQFKSKDASVYQFNLFDIAGRHVMVSEGKAVEGLNLVEIELSSLKPGIYIAVMKNGEGTQQIRIIKE